MKQNNNKTIPQFVFFGGPEISVDFINHLKNKYGILPNLIVTTPDRPAGRKMRLTSPPLKVWADEHNIKCLQPEKFKPIVETLSQYDLFVVVAYGKIIPKFILDIPKHGSINLHPSLLPKYRGPSPIISALLADDTETGISLMLLDELMDHGPILTQDHITIDEWMSNRDLETFFAIRGADLFLKTLPGYLSGELVPLEQNHDEATECRKFTKADMELNLSDQRESYLKYLAFDKPYFFHDDERIIVTEAEWVDNDFVIKKVIPAGRKEIEWKY